MSVRYGKYNKEAQDLKRKVQKLVKNEDADRSQWALPTPRQGGLKAHGYSSWGNSNLATISGTVSPGFYREIKQLQRS